ncbi:MAG TPA: hypothetical protein PK103_02820, partial [Elusimicrobiales bacterium]|nr:hypothetical protein [Elusimicrobiales bacterium]
GYLAEHNAISYNYNFDYDLAQKNVKDISAVVESGTSTISEQTFTNGRYSEGYFEILSTISLRGITLQLGERNIYFGYTSDVSVSDYLIVPVSSTVEGTAINLKNKINTDSYLSGIVIASTDGARVNLISKYADATEYTLYSSNESKVSISSGAMVGGINSQVSTDDEISISNHGFNTGLAVLYTAGTDVIGGLLDGTTYYVIKIDDKNIKLASSKDNAVVGTAVNITSVVLDDSESTYTLTPLDIDGTPGFEWQGSNDYLNWLSVSTSSGNTPTRVGKISGAHNHRQRG